MISTSREQRNIVKRSVTLGGQRGAREIKDDSVITETIVCRPLNPGVEIDPVVERGMFIQMCHTLKRLPENQMLRYVRLKEDPNS